MKTLLPILLILLCIQGSAQMYDATWVMGYANTIYKFNSNSIYRVDSFPASKSLFFTLSGGCMSDKNGNLLYLSNGQQINDRNDNLMEGGDQLDVRYLNTTEGYDFRQNPMSLPMPGSDSLYYFFYEAYWDSSVIENSRLYYNIIDMSANNGLGEVISQNNILIDTFITDGGLSACMHANGIDWWVVKPRYRSNEYFKFLVKANGVIEGPFTQSIGLASAPADWNSELVFSPQGDKMFYTNGNQKGALFDFDRYSGLLSNARYVWAISGGDTLGGVGASFSTNGRFLYLTGDTFKLYQIDTYSDNIDSAKILLTRINMDSDQWPAYHQLAPNGKIYIMGYAGATPLTVINHPDSFGLACGLDTFAYDSLPYVTLGMPNFPYYRTPPARAYQADAGHDTTICFGDTIMLGTPQVDSVVYQWQSAAGFLSNTDIAQPFVAPVQTTSYYLTINDTVPHGYSCNIRTDTITVHVVPQPCVSGLNDLVSVAATLKIYPNPTGNYVNLSYSVANFSLGATGIQITNVLGQVVFAQPLPVNSNYQRVDVSQFASGIYTVTLKQNGAVLAVAKLMRE